MSQQPVVPSALRGFSVSVEAQNIQTMNTPLICTNTDRLHHYFISGRGQYCALLPVFILL